MRRSCLLWALAVLLGACDDDGGPEATAPDDAALAADASLDAAPPPADAAPDAVVPARDGAPDVVEPDAAPDAEVEADLGPPDPAWFHPEPGAYRVGVAVRRMPIPVGIPTSGFGANQGGRSRTPYAEAYPGTTAVHLHPDFRAIVFEAGEGNRLILLRSDTIGVTAAIRRSLVARLAARYGEAVDRQLIIAGTHTHAGPGRLIDKPYWHLIQDFFLPEHYVRMVAAMEETIVAAVDDLEPARVGHGLARTTELHNDRRCANPEEDEPELPIIRVDRVADGQTKALVLFHAVHPTVIGISRLTLSQDVSGGIEAKVAERFDHPVTVLFFNGAAADMGPGSPERQRVEGATPWPDDFARIEAIGEAAADAVHAAWPDIPLQEEGVVHARVARAPISRRDIGYGEGEFPHENGAVYCGAGTDEACVGDELPPVRGLMACIPFPTPESAAPMQVPISAARIGDRMLVTTPGEFAIALGRRVRTEVAAQTDYQDVVIVGYANEYTGYSLPEDDWWHGGYEASGALWGPKQGDYLTGRVIEVALSFADPERRLPFREPPAPPVPGPYDIEPRALLRSAVEPQVLADVPPAAEPGALVEYAFAGGDPWPGNPVVTLERRLEDGTFEPVRTPDGRPVTTDGYEMTLHLDPDPPYTEEADARTFRWTVRLPTIRTYGGGPALRGGTFRLVARGKAHVAGAPDPVDYTLESGSFSVE